MRHRKHKDKKNKTIAFLLQALLLTTSSVQALHDAQAQSGSRNQVPVSSIDKIQLPRSNHAGLAAKRLQDLTKPSQECAVYL